MAKVSLRKSFETDYAACKREHARMFPVNSQRVELLGNTSFGKIVRPEFGGQSIANGQLRPLTEFTGYVS